MSFAAFIASFIFGLITMMSWLMKIGGRMMMNNRQNLIESILEDESLTSGLIDDDAQVIINWCIKEIETKTENDQAVYIKRKARAICKIANDIQDGNENRAKKRLERLVSVKDDLTQIFTFIESDNPLAEKIELLTNSIERKNASCKEYFQK